MKEISGGLVGGNVPPGPPPPHDGDPERALFGGPGVLRGAKHPAEFEHLDVLDAPARVSRQHVEEPGQQRGSQRRLIGDQGVLEHDRRDAPLRRRLRGFERQRQHLGQPRPGQRLPDARVLQQHRNERPRGRVAARHGQRDPVVSMDPGDFLDEILLAHEVGPERGRPDPQWGAVGDGASQRPQDPHHRVLGDVDAQDRGRPGGAQADRRPPEAPGVDVDHPAQHARGAPLLEEGGRPILGQGGTRRIRAAFESRRRLRPDPQVPGRPADRAGVPVGGLEEHGGRGRTDLRVCAADDAGHADRMLGVGDHQHLAVQRAGDAVEGHQRLPRRRAAHDEPVAGDAVVIKGVHRLPEFEHDIVRDVDDVVDRPDARGFQPPLDVGGGRPDAHALDHPGRETGTAFRIRDLDRRARRGGGGTRGGLRDGGPEPPIQQQRDLTRDAEDAHAVGTVGGQLDIENRVVAHPLDLLNGKPDAVQPLDEGLEGHVHLDVLAQPLQRDAHGRR